MNNNNSKDFSTFQFKIPRALWKKFKLVVIQSQIETGNDKTCGNTLVELIERHVGR